MIARASRLPLLAHCQWWSRPDVREPAVTVDRSSPEQARGTAVHAAIEAHLRERPHDVPPEIAPFYEQWRAWLATRTLRPLSIEQRHVLDLATGEVALVDAYDPEETGVVCGTPDLIAQSADGGIAVLDWKTGDDWQGYTAPAAENLQLRTYALFAAARTGAESVTVEVVRITEEGVTTDAHTLDVLDLDAHLSWLRQRVGYALAEPQPGMHCARCDAASVCPATLASGYELTRPGVRLEITERNAARVLERAQQLRAALDQVDAALKAFALSSGGIDLPDGRRWAARVQVRETVDADAAGVEDVLADLGVSAALRTKRSVSWTDAEAIAREANGGKLPRGWKQQAKERLGAIGALKVAEVTQFTAGPARRKPSDASAVEE